MFFATPPLAAFRGTRYNLDGQTITDFAIAPSDATAGVRINTDGTVDQHQDVTYSQIDGATDWITPNARATNQHWVRATLNSGLTPSGPALNTWHQINTPREWFLQETGTGFNTCNLTLEIATDSGGTNIVASGTYILNADVEP